MCHWEFFNIMKNIGAFRSTLCFLSISMKLNNKKSMGLGHSLDLDHLRLLNKCAYVFSVFKMWIRVSFASRPQVARHHSASKSPQGHQVLGMGDSGSGRRGWRESEAVKRSHGVSDLSDRVSDVQGSARALANTPIQEAGMATYAR